MDRSDQIISKGYSCPEIIVVSVNPEQGFAQSGIDGNSISPFEYELEENWN